MRYTVLVTGILGGGIALLFAFYFRDIETYAAIVLTLIGVLGLSGTILSFRSHMLGRGLMLLSVLAAIYFVWDVADSGYVRVAMGRIPMMIPTLLLAVGTVLAFIEASKSRESS